MTRDALLRYPKGYDHRRNCARLHPVTHPCRTASEEVARAAPSPALTREALRDMLDELGWPTPPTGTGRPYADPEAARRASVEELLAALGTPPPAPTSTREETP